MKYLKSLVLSAFLFQAGCVVAQPILRNGLDTNNVRDAINTVLTDPVMVPLTNNGALYSVNDLNVGPVSGKKVGINLFGDGGIGVWYITAVNTAWQINNDSSAFFGNFGHRLSWDTNGNFTAASLTGNAAGLQVFVSTNFIPGLFYTNGYGMLITVADEYTNIWTAPGISEVNLITCTNGGTTSILKHLRFAFTNGIAFTNIEGIWGYVSNGWEYAWTNVGTAAASDTNLMVNGSGTIKAP